MDNSFNLVEQPESRSSRIWTWAFLAVFGCIAATIVIRHWHTIAGCLKGMFD